MPSISVDTLRKTLAFMRQSKPEQCFGSYYREDKENCFCILGCMGMAVYSDPTALAYELNLNAADQLIRANDEDATDFPTFCHFIDSCDDETLADMMASLEETE